MLSGWLVIMHTYVCYTLYVGCHCHIAICHNVALESTAEQFEDSSNSKFPFNVRFVTTISKHAPFTKVSALVIVLTKKFVIIIRILQRTL